MHAHLTDGERAAMGRLPKIASGRSRCAHPYANGATCGLYATAGLPYCGAHQRPHFAEQRRQRERMRLREAIADVAVEMVHGGERRPKTPSRPDGAWTAAELQRARRAKEHADGAYLRLRALVAALETP